MFEFFYFLAGVIVSWLITHIYYRHASKQTPTWAQQLIESFPKDPPTLSQLIRMFQKNLDSGDIKVHPVFGHVACPKCGESAQKFEEQYFSDDTHSILIITCPSCGWSQDGEV